VLKNETAIISKPHASSSEVARQWLVKFAAICQKEFSSALANIWDEQLRDIEPSLLARACDQLMKKWTVGFLPVPGNIREEAKGIEVLEYMKRDAERQALEDRQRREQARLFYEQAIAYAEQKRQLQALEVELPKIDCGTVSEPVHVVDFEARKRELAQQVEEIFKKYPPAGKEAQP
jgi:hypothetical protein